jgi:pimeloyl-ACP methyl ester carboxylesterase
LLTGSEATLRALAAQLGVPAADLLSRASVLGYSLGAAAALQFATRHPVQRIILFSPFTSMLDMAQRVVGSPLCYLLEHRYDNLSSLAELRATRLPRVDVLHGAQDSFIPSEMGEAVARAAPGSHFELVPGADHNDVIDVAAQRLRELLSEPE